MYDAGLRIFLEVGPAARLTGFVRDILQGRPSLALSVDGPPGGLRALLMTVGQLFVHRVPIDTAALFRDRIRPAQRPAPRLATALPVLEVPTDLGPDLLADHPAPTQQPVVTAVDGVGRAAAVSAHLRTMEHFLQVQSDVVSAFLNGRSSTAALPSAPDTLITPTPATGASTEAVLNGSLEPDDGTRQGLDVLGLLRSLISDRTGYPAAMITDDLDLESDLGIDSIKRTEIIGVVQQRIGGLRPETSAKLRPLRTLSAIAAAITEAALPTEPVADQQKAVRPELPWIDEVIERTPGRLTARHRFDLGKDGYLADHTIERHRPGRRDRATIGLPVVPLTASLELAAEAAMALVGNGVVIRIEQIAALRWISVEEDTRTVRLVAERRDHPPGHTAVAVSIMPDEPCDPDRPMLTALVIIAEAYPTAPAPEAGGTGRIQPAGELYGADGLFHGPAFRVINSVDSLGPRLATAELTGPGTEALVPGRRLLTDVALLDGPGQLVAIWLRDVVSAEAPAEPRPDIFPVRVDALELYATPRTGIGSYRCRARIRELSDDHILSDLDVIDVTGDAGERVVARFVGWRDVRLGVDPALRDFLGRPDEACLSQRWQPFPDIGPVFHGRRMELDTELARTTGGLWLEVLAYAVLRAEERDTWRDLRSAETIRRVEWLAGRIAAKEAVRDVLAARAAESASDADIGIKVSDSGAPQVIMPRDATDIRISISHNAGIAVAIATDQAEAVGVDLQAPTDQVAVLGPIAFSPSEQDWLDKLPPPAHSEWATRFWTAKEAAAKALGDGLGLVPAEFLVDPAGGDAAEQPARTGAIILPVRRRDGDNDGANTVLQVCTVADQEQQCAAVCLGVVGFSAELTRTELTRTDGGR
jgi:phosphopantetheinyl transferase